MAVSEKVEKTEKILHPRGVTRQSLRITTAGSVDDGKSTLIGRLMHDTDSLPLDHLEAVTDEEGVADLAALSDGLRAEREQGITIDVAYRFFSTETRSYILADTPGHERYTRNMFTGASNAHVAILLVDARAGVLRQTRRHARIAKLLGIKHFVATVNKIDLIDFDQSGFDRVAEELAQMAARLGDVDITVIPIAAKHGDNVVHRSERTPWYTGPTLLEYLENVELAAPQAEASRLRLPVQWVSRPTDHQRRRYTGRLAAGTLRVGDPVVSLPAGTRSTVTLLDTLDDNRTTGVAPLSVSIELADDIDVGRGDVFVSGADEAVAPVLARELDAHVCWFVDKPLRAGDRLALKQTAKTVRATVQELHSRLDPETLDELDQPVELTLNDIGTVTLRTSSVVVADSYEDNRDTGAFILIDETTNDTVGAGTIIEPREVKPGVQQRTDIRWHPSALIASTAGRPPGSRARPSGSPACRRPASPPSRWPWSAHWSNRAGSPTCSTVTICATASPTTSASPRRPCREHQAGGAFGAPAGRRGCGGAGLAGLAAEVRPRDRPGAQRSRQAALHRGARRDVVGRMRKARPQGALRRARSGELKGLTGVDAPYEAPESPDLVLDTTGADIDELAAQVIRLLDERSPRH